MAKMFPNLAVGYGPKPGVNSSAGTPINKPGTAGSSLVRDIRGSKGWGK